MGNHFRSQLTGPTGLAGRTERKKKWEIKIKSKINGSILIRDLAVLLLAFLTRRPRLGRGLKDEKLYEKS